jgi:hypothetical protein
MAHGGDVCVGGKKTLNTHLGEMKGKGGGCIGLIQDPVVGFYE